MAEFIGFRISLISKRDIRYVGTLHEISSENATVALEDVVSFGTEGRRPDDEVPPSDSTYEYIVFRGSDVKDLRIEDTPKENKPPEPPVPDDPAILGSARQSKPSTQPVPQQQQQSQPQQSQPSSQPNSSKPQQPQQLQQPQQPFQHQQRYQPPTRHPLQPFPYQYAPHPSQRFGLQGFPMGGYPGVPYGGLPPGYYPPMAQNLHYPPPNQFYQNQPPIGSAPSNFSNGQPPQTNQQASSTGVDSRKDHVVKPLRDMSKNPIATVKLPSSSTSPILPSAAQNGPPPPIESKPDVAAALAPPTAKGVKDAQEITEARPAEPRNERIMPVVPRLSPATKHPVPINGSIQSQTKAAPVGSPPTEYSEPNHKRQVATKSIEDVSRDARAALAAAMAKLPSAPGQKKQPENEGVAENLVGRVNEIRVSDNVVPSNTPKQPGNHNNRQRNGRGGSRGGRAQHTKVEVPSTDYDFVSANAKFNKQDLVKEAIAGGSGVRSPINGVTDGSTPTLVNGSHHGSQATVGIPPVASYNKNSSFFDDISSESKDRDESSGKRRGGREYRNEEQKKNVETFGQGSVDSGYRGGYRGRGRGRGYRGPRGGGYVRGGRGGMRGRLETMVSGT